MDFRSVHTIETAEHVVIRLELAGLAARIFACAIDTILMVILMGTLTLAFSLPRLLATIPEIGKTVIPLGIFVIFFGYHLFQEWLWNGKSVGKHLFRLRVVRDNGQPIGFWEAFGRTLLRVLDIYFSGVGLVCMMLNRREKRLGDFLVGTLVISDAPVAAPHVEETPVLTLAPPEMDLLKDFWARKQNLPKTIRQSLSNKMALCFSEKLHRPLADEVDLQALLEPINNN